MPEIVKKLNAALLHMVFDKLLNMVCNRLMTNIPEQIAADKALIEDLGGPAEVARLIGIDPNSGGVQRVYNWMSRGIPAAIRLEHLAVFGLTPLKPHKEP